MHLPSEEVRGGRNGVEHNGAALREPGRRVAKLFGVWCLVRASSVLFAAAGKVVSRRGSGVVGAKSSKSRSALGVEHHCDSTARR